MYGLIGKKLGHSFSADFFNRKFKSENIREHYNLLPIPKISCLPELISSIPVLKGLNVTIPYKEQVIPYLNSLSEEAQEIGAVNVIKIIRDENSVVLKGFNTDCIGFRDSLLPLLNEDIKKALILGTGGASKAVFYVLKKLGIQPVFVSRTPIPGMLSYGELSREIIAEHQLIVNTTPLGMFPDVNKYPPLPYDYITDKHICYDLVYNPLQTEFMKKSYIHGATVKNGLEMLQGQAIAAWNIWTNPNL